MFAAPPELLLPPVDQIVFADMPDVTLTCQFRSWPVSNVTWMHYTWNETFTLPNNRVVLDSIEMDEDGYSVVDTYLYIENFTSADAGNYTCSASNGVGESASGGAILQATSPPTVTPLSSEVIGVVNRDGSFSDITLGFFITGDVPEVTMEDITWMYAPTNSSGKVPLTANNSKFTFTSDRLSVTVSNLILSDDGMFTLTATNDAGIALATVRLTIHGQSVLGVL